MSIVFQNATLLPWRTVLANLMLPFELRGVQGPRENALQTLELVGLTGLENAFVDELSGGMQTRVAIARALVTRPAILLMDEPFGNLDEFNRVRLNLALTDIQQSLGTSILLITHNIHEALLMSDRLLIMADDLADSHATTIEEDVVIDFPNKHIEAVADPRFQQLYKHVISHFHQKRL